jgi:hypothetical protein
MCHKMGLCASSLSAFSSFLLRGTPLLKRGQEWSTAFGFSRVSTYYIAIMGPCLTGKQSSWRRGAPYVPVMTAWVAFYQEIVRHFPHLPCLEDLGKPTRDLHTFYAQILFLSSSRNFLLKADPFALKLVKFFLEESYFLFCFVHS